MIRLTYISVLSFLGICSNTVLAFGVSSYQKHTSNIITDNRRQNNRVLQSSSNSALAAAYEEEDLKLTLEIVREYAENNRNGELFIFGDEGSASGSSSSKYKSPGRPTNDLMIRAALGEDIERTPVWLFRQAGRHLPEYNEYKEKTGRNFLELLNSSDCVAECTMQPLRRYNVDAAILFSDILVIAEALGIDVTMPGGVGIQVPNPLSKPEDVEERIPPVEEMTMEFVLDKLGHVIDAVKEIRAQMEKEDMSLPLIGFSAAPYTLLYYMIGGSSKKNNDIGKKWLNEYPAESQRLLDVLTKIIIEYLTAQVEAGAHMIQLFEAMGMFIDEPLFNKYAMPCLEEIATTLKERFPDVPIMVFARGASFANKNLCKLPYDVVTIDGSVDRKTIRDIVPPSHASIQGNYDPKHLVEGTTESVKETTIDMLNALGPKRLIANLGEGLGGKEQTKLVNVFVETIHEQSEKMIKAEKD